jgi:hypothetical protein
MASSSGCVIEGSCGIGRSVRLANESTLGSLDLVKENLSESFRRRVIQAQVRILFHNTQGLAETVETLASGRSKHADHPLSIGRHCGEKHKVAEQLWRCGTLGHCIIVSADLTLEICQDRTKRFSFGSVKG